MKKRKHLSEDMETLPCLILTSNGDWDSPTLDQDVKADKILPEDEKNKPFQDTQYKFGHGKFHRTGWYWHLKVQV